MFAQSIIDLGREAMFTVLLMASPVLAVGLIVGMVAGTLQTITQVQDQSLSHVPRIVAIIATIAICLPWLVQTIVQYSEVLFRTVPTCIGAG